MTTESSSTIPWYRFHIWAVLAGAAADVISSNITTGCFGVVYAVIATRDLVSQGLTLPEIQAQIMEQFVFSPVTFILGALCSIFGGYIAGRIAKFHEVKHALAAVGVIYIVSALLNMIIQSPLQTLDVPLWIRIVGSTLTIGGQALGGYLAFWQRNNKVAAQVQS
jgi:hypothetical protein